MSSAGPCSCARIRAAFMPLVCLSLLAARAGKCGEARGYLHPSLPAGLCMCATTRQLPVPAAVSAAASGPADELVPWPCTRRAVALLEVLGRLRSGIRGGGHGVEGVREACEQRDNHILVGAGEGAEDDGTRTGDVERIRSLLGGSGVKIPVSADINVSHTSGSRQEQQCYRSKGGLIGYSRGRERGERRSHAQRCGHCGQVGHKRRGCPDAALVQELAWRPSHVARVKGEARRPAGEQETGGKEAASPSRRLRKRQAPHARTHTRDRRQRESVRETRQLRARLEGRKEEGGAEEEGGGERACQVQVVDVDVAIHRHWHKEPSLAGQQAEERSDAVAGDNVDALGSSLILRSSLVKAANSPGVLARLVRNMSVTIKVGRPGGGRDHRGAQHAAAAAAAHCGAFSRSDAAENENAVEDARATSTCAGGGAGGAAVCRSKMRGAETYALSVIRRETLDEEERGADRDHEDKDGARGPVVRRRGAKRKKWQVKDRAAIKLWVLASVVCKRCIKLRGPANSRAGTVAVLNPQRVSREMHRPAKCLDPAGGSFLPCERCSCVCARACE